MNTTSSRKWFRNSYGVITDGAGWEISQDMSAETCGCSDEFGHCARFQMGEHDAPLHSLWHHGEFVGLYNTVEAAKADALPLDCSKCAGPMITSRICRVCRTELLCDSETGAEQHRDVRYDTACAKVRNGRTEQETVLAALRSIDQTGSLRGFRRGHLNSVPKLSGRGEADTRETS